MIEKNLLLEWYKKHLRCIIHRKNDDEYKLILSKTSFLDNYYSKITINQRLWHIINDNYELQYCKICHELVNYSSKLPCYNKLCGSKLCLKEFNLDPQIIESIKKKREKTNLKKYGEISKLRGDEWMKTRLNASKEKYKNSDYSTIFTKDELLEFYSFCKNDVTYHFYSPQYQQILKMTSFLDNHYDKITIGQRMYHIANDDYEIVKCKSCKKILRFQLNHSCYGKTCSMTCFKNYQKTDDYRNKMELTNMERYGNSNYMNSIAGRKLINKNVSFSKLETNVFEIIENICDKKIKKNCFGILDYIDKNEKLIQCEIDLYIPDLKIGFEVNGDYWHVNEDLYERTTYNAKNKDFYNNAKLKDYNKNLIASEKGVKLYTIWESDYKKHKNLICQYIQDILSYKSILPDLLFLLRKHNVNFSLINDTKILIEEKDLIISIHSFDNENYFETEKRNIQIWECDYKLKPFQYNEIILNSLLSEKNQKIYARKCEIKELFPSDEIKDFINDNHVQGYVGYTKCYGLFFNNELVEIMSLKKTNNLKDEWEIGRLCTKRKISIIGGASKLWNHFLNINNPSICITYSDKSLFSGNVYNNLRGMKYEGVTQSGYWYTDGKQKLSRQKFQKHKLIKLYPEYENMTEKHIMTEILGYKIIKNIGNYKFIYTA